MEYKDYYRILGVPRGASADEIKRAYRRLARRFHPDVSKEPNAEARFKEINEAREVLQDPGKRAAYDALGANWRAGQEFRPPPGAGGADREFQFDFGEGKGFSDFFASLFGRAPPGEARAAYRAQGRDLRQRIAIDLHQAYSGCSRPVRIPTAAGGEAPSATAGRTLNVRIPAGVIQGQQIRLAGQGAPGTLGAPAGDLYLEVEIKPHAHFSLEGRDVHLRLPIAPWEAALGAAVTVPTLGGSVTLKIPPGAQSGNRLRLKGRGLPGTPPGDELVILDIVAPPAATEAARQAYRDFAERLRFNPRADLGV